MADRSERIAKLAIFRGGVAHPIGRNQRKIERAGNCNSGAVARFFLTMEMTLQLDVYIAAAKQSDQLLDLCAGFFAAAMLQSGCQRPVCTAGQAIRPGAYSSSSS